LYASVSDVQAACAQLLAVERQGNEYIAANRYGYANKAIVCVLSALLSVSEGDRSTRKGMNMSRCVTACDSEAVRRLSCELVTDLISPCFPCFSSALYLHKSPCSRWWCGAGKSGGETELSVASTERLYIFYD